MNKTIEMWVDVDYWQVHDESDNELYRGSKTACQQYARKHGGIVAHVILEKKEMLGATRGTDINLYCH